MASLEKKRRVEASVIVCLKEIEDVLLTLFTPIKSTIKLKPIKILHCNAADKNVGISFSKAYCCTDHPSHQFLIVDIFQRGLQILIDLTKKGEISHEYSKQEQHVLHKLIQYIEKGGVFPSLERNNETELNATIVANHLFGQLATTTHYTIDKDCPGKVGGKKCHCGIPGCKLTGVYGDTSIGSEEVWHGHLDIIVNDELGVGAIKNDPDSLGDISPVDVKLKSGDLSRNPQIIAETIVFSFLQKKRHPEKNHFLSPCIGVEGSDMILMFYDSEHDILLESSKIPLQDNETGEQNLVAVVVSWLVVNHKYLCTGVTEDMKEFKADFFPQVKGKLEVYQNNLRYGDIYKMSKKVEPEPVTLLSKFAIERYHELSSRICKSAKGIGCDETARTSQD